ncbi:MAG: hypothetical protein KGH79_01170 [Patescibacteria group bacterium]|nr:hypothetical protein [Patescibacteria group bacterium]
MTQAINTALRYQQLLSRAAVALACICAVSAFLYGVFLLEAVAHTAALQSAEAQVIALNAKLGDLESQYLAQTASLTPERAAALGFVVPADITTVFVTAASKSLSLAH